LEEIKVILVNPWWNNPYLIALFSSLLTGIVFALALHLHNRRVEKKDVLISLSSELYGNYFSIKKIQDISDVKGIEKNDGMIAAMKKGNPLKESFSDEEIALDEIKNISMDNEISIECWNKLHLQLAKYPNEYSKYEVIYGILKRIIRYSKIKSGEINTLNIAEMASANVLGAIRLNSEDFIKKYEEYFQN